MKNENFCRIMILILLISSLSPLLQFAGIDIIDTVKAEILDDYQTGWDHYVQFSIDHDFIDEDLTNFPILVVLNSTIGAAANGGNSIRFLSEDLTTQYYYQIETWNPAGNSYVWVRINHISSTEDIHVVMFYGNATAVGQNSTEVWDANYMAVWHMNSLLDSTSNNIDLTNVGADSGASGKIGECYSFVDTNSDYMDHDTLLDVFPDGCTYETWIYPEKVDSTRYIMSKSNIVSKDHMLLRIGYIADDELLVGYIEGQEQGGDARYTASASALSVNTWHYTSLVYEKNTKHKQYLDLNTVESIGNTLEVSDGTYTNFTLGAFGGASFFDGLIDEARVSNARRSDAWINATFHTQNQTTGFFTWYGGIDPATVYTNAATNIDTTSATFNGHLLFNGSKQTWYGFRYGKTSDALSTNYTVGTDGANNTPFSYGVTGLDEGRVYYVQAWLNNSKGFSTGSITSFWTDSEWANTSLEYRRRITIDDGFICENLTNFPILVIINNTSIGYKCDGGNSIQFHKNSTVEYYHEIDTWNNTTSYVWVNVTHILDDADTVFYMYYNNSLAVSTESAVNVWDANFMAVWHMNDLLDGTSNDVNVTNVGADSGASGKIGECYGFVAASNDYMFNDTFLDVIPASNELTFEVWAYHVSDPADSSYVSKRSRVSKDRFTLRRSSGDRFLELFAEANEGGNEFCTDTIETTNDTWHYQVGIIKATTAMKIYRDTVLTTGDVIGTFIDGSENDFEIGAWAGAGNMDGYLDEIRISNIVRSECWINASHHSQNNTTGFFTWGEEESTLNVQTNDPIAVYTQNATLSGTLVFLSGLTTVRFQLNNSSVSYLTGRNTTNQTFSSLQSFTNNTSLPPLNPGERYWYRAYANDTIYEAWGENKSFLTQPNASTNLVFTQGNLQTTLTWTDNDGGVGCYIEFSENYDPGPGWVFGNNSSLGNQTTPYIHTGLNLGSTYYYKAWAYASDDGWQSEFANTSAPFNQTGITGNAKAIRALQVTTNNTTGVEATNVTMWGWLNGSGNDAFATVRFQFNNSTGGAVYTPGYWYWNTSNQSKSSGQTFYNNTNLNLSLHLNPGDRYYYRAYANNTSVEDWGANLSFLTKPYAQTGFDATSSAAGQITLNWTNQLGGDGCYIEFSENYDPGPGWIFGNNTSLGYQTTPYHHTGLNNSSVYYYKAWAYAADDGWRSAVGNTSAPLNISGLTSYATCIGGINITTNVTTGVKNINATLWGWLNYTGDGSATVRFQYNNTTGFFAVNTTNQTKNAGDTFSQDITGLTPGVLYHYRSYGNNTVNNTTGAHMVFLTKPNASTNLVISLVGGGDNGFNLTWTNNTGCNRTVVVRNNTSFPTDPYDGWEIYNGTNQSFIDDPLTSLDTYYYRIWAYANWTWDGVDYHQFSDGNISDSRTYVAEPVVPLNSTTVTTTSATLRLYFDGAGTEYQVGFWVSCLSPTSPPSSTNYTVGTYTASGTYTKDVSGLEEGQYYYIKTWGKSVTEFIISSTITYMIMIPNSPTNLHATSVGGDSIQLDWAEFSLPGCAGGSAGNTTTVIRYTTSLPYPSGSTGANGTATGTWLYNGTLNNYLHSSLDADTTYYYSMWTYVNDSGSPLLHAWSSSYSTVSAGTEGGNYTITLRYENVSYNTIPITRGVYHTFTVHYADKTEYNFWNDTGALITTGTYANESDFTSNNPASGNFSFNASARPLWMEFRWNDTGRYIAAEFRCNRIIIPQSGQRNVTFYLRIDVPVFRETVFAINGTLVKYAYSFVDETGFFDTESNALAEIFFYNSAGDKIIVHSEYWDTELKMYPWLVYSKKYFMGVYCDVFSVANLGIAPSEQNEEPQIVIPFSYTETNNFFEYINLTIEWHDATTLRLTYLDTDYSSTNVTLKLYYWNNTHISTDYYNNLSNFNHFWLGLNNTYSYKIEVITVNDIWPDGLSSGRIPFYGVISLSVTNTTLDNIMTTIFGKSPLWVQNIDGSEREVPWSQVIIFGVAFILLVTLGKLNAFLGMSITGGWLIFSTIAITGVQLEGGAALITVGIFLIAISIIGLLGGVERK